MSLYGGNPYFKGSSVRDSATTRHIQYEYLIQDCPFQGVGSTVYRRQLQHLAVRYKSMKTTPKIEVSNQHTFDVSRPSLPSFPRASWTRDSSSSNCLTRDWSLLIMCSF